MTLEENLQLNSQWFQTSIQFLSIWKANRFLYYTVFSVIDHRKSHNFAKNFHDRHTATFWFWQIPLQHYDVTQDIYTVTEQIHSKLLPVC